MERCLKSVVNQTYTNIECIIVDDATQDDSIVKCERIIKEYDGPIEFRILHHEKNRGLSAARNTGTKAVTGDYLYYLDSDDYISADCIEVLMAPFKKDEALEMVQGNCKVIRDGGEGIVYNGVALLIENNHEVRAQYLLYHHIYISVWNRLLKRSFVEKNGLYCKEGIIHEDHLWMFYLMKCLQKAHLSDAITYYHPIRPGSIVTSTDKITEGNSFRVIFDEILHHLTPDKEDFELQIYLYMFCKRYLAFVDDVPTLRETVKLYRTRARQYGCWYVNAVLVAVGVIGYFGNPSRVLGKLNALRWRLQRKSQR